MVRQYVGARYVPKFADPVAWASGTSYEAMTIVTYNNSSYTSKMPVPATVGNPADNPDYWALTGNYNAQVEQYRKETETVSNSLTTEITNRKNADTALQGQISAVSAKATSLQTQIITERSAREEADSDLSAKATSLQTQISEERTERSQQDAVLSARMDSFSRLPDGSLSTAADAELVNIRVMADGKTASTAGNAVREQVTELKGNINVIENATLKNVKSVNLFNWSAVNANKTLNSNGQLVDSTTNSTSDIMECSQGDTIYIVNVRNNTIYKNSAASARWLALYDSNMNLISIDERVNNVSVTSADAKYFRITVDNSVLSASTKFSVTLNTQPNVIADIKDYYNYYVNSASDTRVHLIDYLPSDFRREKKCDDVQTYINAIVSEFGNNRYSILMPEGELNFTGTALLPYKVAIYASQGTIINVASNVTAFEWNAETYPMATIYDGDGCAFDGGGCRFNLAANSVGIKINGENADSNTAFARRYISNISFKGFANSAIGIYYVPNHVYLIKHEHLIFSTMICIRWGDNVNNAQDSGENMSFDGCVFAHIPVYLCTFSLNARFINCSFDYCDAFCYRPSGNTSGLMDAFITNCHFERNKRIGGGGLILRGNATYFTEPNSNEFDVPPFTVVLGKGSNLKLKPTTRDASEYNCVVMSSPYIEFIAPRQSAYMLLNPSKNLVPSNYDGGEPIKIFHNTDYIGIYVVTDGTIAFTNDITNETITFTPTDGRIYEYLKPGNYTLSCSSAVSNIIVNSLL